ncbi:thiamine phosphate synthase [Pedobacter alpinus]|uniref:Thiamine-phosphate synthase n=1 Tax=Pedobacter alpinus TaxID=1590643 RepID=A0ABW5TRN1_9SPHI
MISQLHYISQSNSEISHLKAIENALKAGCKWIQLRIKDEPLDFVLDAAIAARQLCNAYKAKLIINDYPEIAIEVKADGLHLGLQDMSIPAARAIVGDQMIIGGTANTLAHILLRVEEGADYIGLGPYRFTKTKKNLSPILGLAGYQSLIKEINYRDIKIPIIAIGGIELADISVISETGIYGVAVSGAINYAENQENIIAQINKKLENRL